MADSARGKATPWWSATGWPKAVAGHVVESPLRVAQPGQPDGPGAVVRPTRRHARHGIENRPHVAEDHVGPDPDLIEVEDRLVSADLPAHPDGPSRR